ncbi:synaptotagmin-like protein 4 isoform X3 [Xenia sp. Carnegie-2017]|uniref:synaptotagmin-like protein 4 isoform X3 n=1 Tax=Xenia sp. Carnegie-2017 TaxID=2897299 RepID=UPI001F0393B9|nr:synaptotagmin-like protein 4 isoform X3 [Xenia sp. Carnegie-2017]
MSQDVLLDLSFLTENERDLINSVLNKDAVLRQSEQQRVGSLRKDLNDLKENGLPEEEIQTRNEKYCARCQTYFGIIFNRGAYCPRCQLKICNSCRVPNAEDGWICTLCHRVREVKAQSGAWFFQGHKQKKGSLFGSTLVRQSLRRYPNNETQPYKGNSYIKDDDNRHKFQNKTIIDMDESEDESEFDSEDESVDQSAVSDETNSKEPEDSSELEMNTPDRLQDVSKEGLAIDVDQRSLDLGNQKYSEFDKEADEVIVNDPNESENAEKGEDSCEMRIMALEKFSESFAVVNHNTGKENTQFDGSDDERSADRLQYKGVAHTDMDSKTLNDSGYVGSNVNFNVKQTPSISGVEASSSPHQDRTIKFSEKAPIIITSKPPEEKLDHAHASIDDYEEDMDVSFKRYGIGLGNRPLKDQLSLGSRESIMSYYSNAGGEVYGKYPVSGEILFGMKYDHQGQEFQIQVHQARDIAAVDKKHNISDPYVKTYLLPDRSRDGKRKSKIIKKTINPIFDEILTYRIRYDELLQRTLWLAVWNNDRFGHNDFLGEVVLSIDEYQSSGFNLEDPDPMWRSLCERQSEDVQFSFNGEIVVALKYVPPSAVVDNSKKKKKKKKKEEKGELHVKIIEARDLIAKDSNGFSDPFCKSYLLPDKSKKTKQKTSVVKKSLNPKWNYHFIYDNLTHEELMDRVLELTVWDFDRGSSNEFLGGVRLGLGAGIQEWDDASSEEQAAWNKMLNNQNEWNEISLTLRDHMGKNNSNVISFDTELDENIVEAKQNGHSAESREVESHDDHLVRHDEYYSPRESKIDAAMRLNQEKFTKSLPGQTQPSKENKMTLAELAAQTSKNRGTSSPSRSPVLSARKIQCPKYLRPLSASFTSVSTPDISLHGEISSGNGSTGEQQHIDVTDESQTSIRRFSDASVLSSRDSRLRVGSNASDFLRRRSLETNSLRSGSTLSVDESWKGSQTSVYSMDDVSGSHAVSGDIMLSYMYYKGNFKVKIFEARGLLAMDESKNTSNPYVKVFLLPDKSRQGKRKTKTKHETLHPEFNEELLFEIGTIELLRRTLWVTVWHYDRFGRNGFLGEVRLPLSDFPGSEVKSHWYPLLQAGPKEDGESTLTGQLVVALMFTKEEKKRKKSNENGKLHVKVVEARNLPGKNADGFSDPFCKCCLLPDPSKTSKRKTPVKKRNLNPTWNHKFSYDNLTIEDLKHKVLELTVWDNHLLSNVFLGCVRIGMGTGNESWDDCRDEEVKLWEFVLSKPNTWAESTLPLRSNIV